jgi:hypothetical protein
VAAQAQRQSPRDDFDLTAKGVPGLLRLVDAGDDLLFERPVDHPDWRLVGHLVEREGKLGGRIAGQAAQRDNMAPDLDPEFLEQPAGEGAGGDSRSSLPGTGSLQDIPGIVPIILEDAYQVGMTGARAGDLSPAGLTVALRRHHVFPVGPVTVADLHRDGRPHGLPAPYSGQPLDLVRLDLHPRAAAVALHPALELMIDVLGSHWQAGGNPLHDDGKGLAVGFTRRDKSKSHPYPLQQQQHPRISGCNGLRGSGT